VARVQGTPLSVPAKPNKYHARPVHIDGIRFASKWEGHCYVTLKWQARAGRITFPLIQVPFALGKHYGRERRYIADFTWVDLQTGCLVVADAKGCVTATYRQKRRTFQHVYGMCITEYHRERKRI
jgi:hypothetical protein